MRLVFSIVGLSGMALLSVSAPGKDIYRWRDDAGVWHFSDRSNDPAAQRVELPKMIAMPPPRRLTATESRKGRCDRKRATKDCAH